MGGVEFFARGDFSLEGGGTLPQNSYNPSRDLCEATLLRRTLSVQRLVRFFGTNIQTQRQTYRKTYRQTHRQTSCYFILGIFTQRKLVFNCYVSHRTIDSFPQIVKCKTVNLIAVLVVPRGLTNLLIILWFFIFHEKISILRYNTWFISMAQTRL